LNSIEYKCPDCNGLLLFKPNIEILKNKLSESKNFNNFWDFDFAFPSIAPEYHITLGEGFTPLRKSKKIGENYNVKNLFFKDETHNPTNSFKDRAAALLISHAYSWDFQKIICASNGNQGASIAAYSSLESIECLNIIPKDIDVGKKAQMITYNSDLKIIGTTVDDSIDYIRNQKKEFKDYYQGTPELNPLTIEGQKTIAFEIFQEINVPDWIIVPMGSGGLLLSLWKGFNELLEANIINSYPKFVGVQSQVCSPIVNKFNENRKSIKENDDIIKSLALGILVKKPLYQKLALRAIKESNGKALAIPENLILTSAEELANNEGIFAEPTSALTIAALNILSQKDIIDPKDSVICIITGSGFKTPYVIESIFSRSKTIKIGGRGVLSTKLKILSQIAISEDKGINGSQIHKIIGSGKREGIYQHLKELESNGLVNRKKEGKFVIYFITENGKKVLNALDTLLTLL